MFLSDGALVTKTPVSLTSSSWFPSMPPMSTHGWPSAYAGIFQRQLWVYVVVSKRARATARLPLPVYERRAQGRERADGHPMATLLRNPNPGMTSHALWLWTSATFDIYGDTFWLKRRLKGQVVGLYPLHPSAMSDDDGTWNFDNGKLRLMDIPDSDLVRFRDFHPNSLTRGLSPLEPLRSTLENEWAARTATSSFWQRGARPGMALTHPGELSEAAQARLKAQMDNVSAGADKTGVTVVLEEGMTPQVMTLTAEEAQYIETRKLNRGEVCAAYDMPPPAVQILDNATFSNITEQFRSVYRDTMGAILPGFEGAIELDLRRAEWPDDDVYAEFLMDEVLRGDFETRQDALAKAAHMTIAEKRKVENLPFIEGTDRIFLNTATMPLDAIDAQSAAIVAQTESSADPLAEVIPLSVARSVMGRLSWQQTLSEVDLNAVTEGLGWRDVAVVTKAVDAELAEGGSVAGLRGRIHGMGVKMARVKALATEDHQSAIRSVLSAFFKAQSTLPRAKWDATLTDDLHAVAVTVSAAIGQGAVREMGFDPSTYSVERTIDFLRAVAARLAKSVNDTTRAELAGADEPATVFAGAESRAPGVATYAATFVAGFAVVEAGKQVAGASGKTLTKTWLMGPNPRPAHAALDGQTVGIDESFSNGADWPGDDGEPGCNCSVEVSV